MESESEMESADECGKYLVESGDGPASVVLPQQTNSMDIQANEHELVDLSKDRDVRPKTTSTAAVGISQQVQPTELINEAIQEDETLFASGPETVDVASGVEQGRSGMGMPMSVEPVRSDDKLRPSGQQEKARTHELLSLGVLDKEDRFAQPINRREREQPGFGRSVPKQPLIRQPQPISGDINRIQGPFPRDVPVARRRVNDLGQTPGRTVQNMRIGRRMLANNYGEEMADEYAAGIVDMQPQYEDEDYRELHENQAAAAERNPRARHNIGSHRARRNRVSSSDESMERVEHRSRARLPPFTAKESWEVWSNRFKDVAQRRRWSKERRLDELIPLIQGTAGDFVYGQLSERIRRNYDLLMQELSCRYRTVEQRRTMGAKFSHRNQKINESVRDYAADLKLLYDKAHPDHDRQTWMEDLLRKFLDGMNDEDASFHVEYVKDPLDIDEAANEVINYRETKRRPDAGHEGRKSKRTSRVVEEDFEEEDRIARLPGRPPRNNKVTNDPSKEGDEVVKNSSIDKCFVEIKEL